MNNSNRAAAENIVKIAAIGVDKGEKLIYSM